MTSLRRSFQSRTHRRALLVACTLNILLAATPVVAHAQSGGSGPPAVVITGRDLGILGGATLGAAVLSLFDAPIARAFADSSLHENRPLQRAADATSKITETLLMITGGTVWAISRLSHSDGAADVALHTTESIASGAMVIQVVRGIAGRARPYVVGADSAVHDSKPFEFQLFHGFTSFDYRSFPSMHAMANLAAATALSQEMRQRHTPGRGVVSPLLYLAATIAPLSRMYLDEHWASDIALGAFLGVFAGQKVVTYSHEHPGNPVDRHFLKPEMNIGVRIDGRGASMILSPFSRF